MPRMFKSVCLNDLFKITYGKFIPKSAEVPREQGVPHIVTTKLNNGVGYYVKDALFPANCMTVATDGSVGETFYQEEPFSAGNIVAVLQPRKDTRLNSRTFCYFATLIRKQASKYSWGEKFSVERVRNTEIILPIVKKQVPNYTELQTVLGGGLITMSNIDTSKWKEFKLVDIAKLSNGNKLDKNKMTHENPIINFVSRTGQNNGVSDVVDIIKGLEPYKSGCITLAFGGSVGSCFLQEKSFYTGQNVGVIELPDELTRETKLFIVSVLEKKCKMSFTAFGDEINKHFKTDLAIKLPVTEVEEIDWDFMDKSMRALEKVVIADVVKYKDKVIQVTKEVVNSSM